MDISLTKTFAPPEEFRTLFPSTAQSPWRNDSSIDAVWQNPAATFRKFLRSVRKRLPSFSNRQRKDWMHGALGCIDADALEHLLPPAGAAEESNGKSKPRRVTFASTTAAARNAPPADESRQLLLALLLQGHQLDDGEFWNVWQRSLAGFQACQGNLDPPQGAEVAGDRQFQLAVELRWLAAAANRDFVDADRWIKDARQALGQWLTEHTDENGIPYACEYDQLPAVLRALGRCVVLADRLNEKLLRGKDHKRLRRFLQAIPALMTSAGKLAGLNSPIPWTQLSLLADDVCGKSHAALAAYYREIAKSPTKPKVKVVPNRRCAFQSDETSLAALRRSWSPATDACVVGHDSEAVSISLQARGAPVIAGNWNLQLRAGDQPVELLPNWSCTCWFSDSDGDFMELQQELPGGIRHERQIYLSRKEHFLILTESLHSDDPEQEIGLTSQFGLATGWSAKRGKTTREWELKQRGKSPVRIYPLGLEQEITHKAVGDSKCDGREFTLTASGRGGVYLPIILDWSPKRASVPAQWRKLTVSENRRVVTDSEASAYRLRSGERQWFLYHSMKKPSVPRAVLGEHTLYETVFARLDAKGEMKAELNVE